MFTNFLLTVTVWFVLYCQYLFLKKKKTLAYQNKKLIQTNSFFTLIGKLEVIEAKQHPPRRFWLQQVTNPFYANKQTSICSCIYTSAKSKQHSLRAPVKYSTKLPKAAYYSPSRRSFSCSHLAVL